MNPFEPSPYEQLNQIARDKLGIKTLETRHMDSLDFHEVAVWCLRNAMEAAFNAGVEHGRKLAQLKVADNSKS